MSRPPSSLFIIAAIGVLVGCAPSAGLRQTAPDPIGLKRWMARTLVEHRHYQAAMAPLRELLAQRPGDVDARVLLGIVYRDQGLHDAAEQELRAAIATNPNAAAPRSELGILLDMAGKPEPAITEHRRAVELAPANAAYHNNLGWSLMLSGRFDDAAAEFLAALKHDPGSRRSRNNLGLAYGRAGDLRRATRAFQQAGTVAESENNVGLAREMVGATTAACGHYRRAMTLDPELAVAPLNLARACPGEPATLASTPEVLR